MHIYPPILRAYFGSRQEEDEQSGWTMMKSEFRILLLWTDKPSKPSPSCSTHTLVFVQQTNQPDRLSYIHPVHCVPFVQSSGPSQWNCVCPVHIAPCLQLIRAGTLCARRRRCWKASNGKFQFNQPVPRNYTTTAPCHRHEPRKSTTEEVIPWHWNPEEGS